MPKFSPNGGHFGYLDFSKYVFSNGFYWDVCRKGFLRNTYLFHSINVEKMTIFLEFRAIWDHFRQFLATYRYPKHEIFFPCMIFHSITFTHQFSCFNIHNIQRIALLAQNFHQMGAILGTKISLIMFLAMVFTGMYVGRVF